MERECPTCGKEIIYTNRGGFQRGIQLNTSCRNCTTVLNNPNVINNLTKDNCKNYTAGQIIRYIYTFPHKEWENKFIEILNYFNPNIEYRIIGRTTAREKNIEYRCKIHTTEWIKTDFRHIVERHSGCRMCKGQHFQNYWSNEVLYDSMRKIVLDIYEKTGCTFTPSSLVEWDSKLFSSWFNKIENPSHSYYILLESMGLPNPSNGVYVKDGNFFRGFYEFVGYCLITNWGVPFQYSPKVFDNYISDGFFTDLNTYWEHWGELNKNNKKKKKLYKDNGYGLFETYDKNCNLNNLYQTIRDFLINNGYTIPEMNHEEILGVIKGSISNFDDETQKIIKLIRKNSWENNLVEYDLRPTYEGNVILSYINKYFDGQILKLKEYLNKNYDFNYKTTAFRGSYKNYDYFISKIKDIIDEYGFIPTQKYFAEIKRNDIPVMASRMCNGLNNLRRNEIEEGPYFYLVKDLYENDSAPYDRELVWDEDENYDKNVCKIINYYSEMGYDFPKTMNDFRYDIKFSKFGPTLHSAISRKGGWNKFKETYKLMWVVK
jgi:hypothetical protein